MTKVVLLYEQNDTIDDEQQHKANTGSRSTEGVVACITNPQGFIKEVKVI